MKEGTFFIEQLNRPEVFEPGLTTGASRSYAEYGEIFMADGIAIEASSVPRKINEDKAGEKAELEAAVANSDEILVFNQLTQEEIEKKQKSNQIDWDGWMAANNKELLAGDYSLVEALKKHGLTPVQFSRSKDFYRSNRVLFESKTDPKEIVRLINVWKNYFDKTSQSQEEYRSKWQLIVTLGIASGLSPRGFARRFKWSSYFETPPPPTVSGIIKQLIKDFVVEVVAGVAAPVDDPQKTLEENRMLREERKQAYARVLWGAVNKNKEDKGEQIKADELSTQKHAIEIGALPEVRFELERGLVPKEVVNFNSQLGDEERVQEVESLLRVSLTEEQKEAFIRAHNFGVGQKGKDGNEARVFNYTEEQIAEKARILHTFFTRDQRRLLMEAGLAGNGNDAQEGAVSSEDEGEENEVLKQRKLEAIKILSSLNDEQKVQANDLVGLMYRWETAIDINDPVVANMVASIVKEMLPGQRVTTTHLELAKNKLQERGFFDEGDRAHVLTEEEMQEIRTMWDQNVEIARAEGRNVNDPAYMGKVQQAKTRGWSPTQIMIEAPWPQEPHTDRERGDRNVLSQMDEIIDPRRKNKKEGQKEKGFSDAILWTDVQRAHKGLLRDQEGRSITDPQDIAEYEYNLYDGKIPRNLEDLAWQIGKSDPRFSVAGEFPVLEIVYRDSGERAKPKDLHDPEKTEARVNKGNFMRWVRDRMMYQHDDNPDDELNLFQAVSIPKSWRPVTLQDIVEHPGIYLKKAGSEKAQREIEAELNTTTDEDKRRKLTVRLNEVQKEAIDEDLLDEIKREVWLFANSRIFDLKYREKSGVPEELVSTLQSLFAKSPFTKTVWGNKSSLYWIMTMDQDFAKVKKDKDGKLEEGHDRKMGQAINTAYLAYFNLTDTEKLREILGKDSVLLSRKGLIEVRNKVRERDALQKKSAPEGYMEDKDIDAMFDEKGNVIEEKFVKTMNIWSSPQTNAKVESLVRAAVVEDITRIAGLHLGVDENGDKINDTMNSHFAETYAYTMTRWTGAAGHNNLGAAGFDAWGGKFQHTEKYRAKMAGSGYGGGYGNPYTVHMLRMLATDFMTGVRTETFVDKEDRKKNPNRYEHRFIKNAEGKENKVYKTPLEVLEEMHDAWKNAKEAVPSGLSKDEEDKAFEEAYKLASNNADIQAGQLVFPGNTMKYFSNDHLKRALDMFNQVINAEEIKLEKFTKLDVFKGVTFERDQFQSAVQEKFLKPMRYWARTWKQMDFSQKVRFDAGDGKTPKWEDRTLAESMFGREMIDVPEFWKRVDEGTPGAKKYHTRSAKGGSKWEWTWRVPHEISGAEINENRDQLVKQMAKVRIAAELYSHVDANSNDPRYDFRFYETVMAALESIPGGIEGDEDSLKGGRTNVKKRDRFFSEDDIKWIRKKSRTTFFWTYGWAILGSVFWDGLIKGSFDGLGDAGKYIAKITLA